MGKRLLSLASMAAVTAAIGSMFVTSAMVGVELMDGNGKVVWQQAPHLLKK